MNCGDLRHQIASLWPLKCCSIWPQQTTVSLGSNSLFVTTQMLWPLVTMNCGVLKHQIASLWPLKCYSIWPQQTMVSSGSNSLSVMTHRYCTEVLPLPPWWGAQCLLPRLLLLMLQNQPATTWPLPIYRKRYNSQVRQPFWTRNMVLVI